MTNEILTNNETSINKSNTLSTSKLSSRLNLNQMQLFAYAILVTQQDGVATFSKADFERQFSIEGYNSERIYSDCVDLGTLRMRVFNSVDDWELGSVVFENIYYKRGKVCFIWHKDMLPHITDLKNKYTRLDLNITKNFKSRYSWTLYEFLLAKYGYYQLEFSKVEMLEFFNVTDSVTYQKNTANFKVSVLDVAIAEINKHTELTVRYDELKKGRAITGFKLYFSKGKQIKGATAKQTDYTLDLIAKLKEDYIFRIIDIDDAGQSKKANDLIMSTLRSVRAVDFNKLTHERADELIKYLNSIIKLLDKMILDDKDNTIEKDKYADFEIPIYDFNAN